MSDRILPARLERARGARPGTHRADARRRSPGRSAVAGGVAALAGIGGSELVAGIVGGPSALAAVGSFLIDRQPPGAKDVVVGLFGTNDKLAFELAIVLIAVGIGAVLGVLARRSFAIAATAFGVVGVIAFLAALTKPDASPTTALIVAAVAAVGGIQVLSYLLGPTTPAVPGTARTSVAAAMPDWSRRAFLVRAGSIAVASSVSGVAGRRLLEGGGPGTVAGGAPAVQLAKPVQFATIPSGAELGVDGVTPLVVPNADFYRIDTALLTPSVDVASWRLRVHGLVDRAVTLSYADLAELPLIEQYVTIACVSNEVGGNLVGNAKWTGVRLREVLRMAGVQPAATQLVGRSVDGWTAGMPTAWVMDGAREPMIALQMNDAPLPRNHGYPARLIVPGLFGYVSATKWLSELELTTLEAFDGYWVPLGWSKNGPILTQSRIDTPRNGTSVAAGRVPVAGVAWAPDRGISKVEVAVDGEWREATLSTPISDATWVQWLYAWDASAAGPGSHVVEVRATDGTGSVQTSDRTPPAPNGARGYHGIRLSVS